MPSKCHTVDSGVCVSGSSTAVRNMVSLQNFCVRVVQYSSQLPVAVSEICMVWSFVVCVPGRGILMPSTGCYTKASHVSVILCQVF